MERGRGEGADHHHRQPGGAVAPTSLVQPRQASVIGLQRARQVAAALLPAEASSEAQVVHGEFHDVVLLAGRAVVKIARGRAVDHLERRAHLSGALAGQGLPFAVPVPLGPVAVFEDCSAVALSWVPGAPAPAGTGDPCRLIDLLEALAGIDVSATGALAPWLDVPHAYAGREGWSALMEQVIAALPEPVRAEAGQRVHAAAQLAPVPAVLVHGDLAGDNVRWNGDGSLAGIIDWDLASAWDPAVDAGCLAWFGWPAVAAAVDVQTYQRARTWADTFHLEWVAAAIDNGEDQDVITKRLLAATRELSSKPHP